MRSAFDVNGLIRRTKGISTRASQAVVSPIKEMALLADEVENTVSIGWGLPSFSTPSYIRDAVQNELSKDPGIGKYPNIRGLPALRDAIADVFRRRRNSDIDPDREILVTVGAQQALFATILTIVNPGDEVILITPVFPSYIDQVIYAGGNPVYVSLDEDSGWTLDIEKVKQAITVRTKALILNFPANPTGTVYQQSALLALAELAIKHQIFLITDETYEFLVYEDNPPFSLFQIPDLREYLIGCYSFSKEYAMTGWRVGYLCAEQGLIHEILKVHDASVITAPRISQVAALTALKGPQDSVSSFRKELLTRRDLMCTRLDKLDAIFMYHRPSGAYYIYPRIKVPNGTSFDFAMNLLYKAKVVTIPGGAFGPNDTQHLRFCFGVPREDIVEAFDRLERYF